MIKPLGPVDTSLSNPEIQIAADSLTRDSLGNTARENARPLDARYFKRSFSLHKKVYIALNLERYSGKSS